MRGKPRFLPPLLIFSIFSLLIWSCAQPPRGRPDAGGGERFQAFVAGLEQSKDPKANRLARKLRYFAMELRSDGKDIGQLRPYLVRVEQLAREGNFEAADRELNDAAGQAYNAVFWKQISFASSDGFRVYAYLTQPKTQRKSPMIVLVHGGEHGSATSYERHAFQFLKDGFATIAVDYRGSSGHGESYRDAADPAGKEIDDVLEAVEYARDMSSTSKVGLMGSSHGAFLAGNVLTRTSLVSAANLNFGGYDYVTMLEAWEKSGSAVARERLREWSPIVGDPENPDPRARALSLIYNVDKIHAPVLLIHGEADEVVPYTQSVNLYNEMKKEDKTVTLKLYPDEPHGFIFRNNQDAKSAFETTEKFFSKYLK